MEGRRSSFSKMESKQVAYSFVDAYYDSLCRKAQGLAGFKDLHRCPVFRRGAGMLACAAISQHASYEKQKTFNCEDLTVQIDVDSQESLSESIIVMVVGFLYSKEERMQFFQTFIIAQQQEGDERNLFVCNDMLWYSDEKVQSPSTVANSLHMSNGNSKDYTLSQQREPKKAESSTRDFSVNSQSDLECESTDNEISADDKAAPSPVEIELWINKTDSIEQTQAALNHQAKHDSEPAYEKTHVLVDIIVPCENNGNSHYQMQHSCTHACGNGHIKVENSEEIFTPIDGINEESINDAVISPAAENTDLEKTSSEGEGPIPEKESEHQKLQTNADKDLEGEASLVTQEVKLGNLEHSQPSKGVSSGDEKMAIFTTEEFTSAFPCLTTSSSTAAPSIREVDSTGSASTDDHREAHDLHNNLGRQQPKFSYASVLNASGQVKVGDFMHTTRKPYVKSPPVQASPPVASARTSITTKFEGVVGSSVYVRNLPSNITLTRLYNEFKLFGALKPGGVNLRNHQVKPLFAFVDFKDVSSAQKAIKASPITIDGHKILIQEKKRVSMLHKGSIRRQP